ncbi:DUF7004 family protein [Parapedobacter koreensis]|uniref:Uncharacterized protein n=1 Tax=Parapedobacter koreensis TaxID=332977 RepID=A0A1H7QN87_9SPHI|nr:hypothetical protein [Parapedobacter koreensis]SEL49218.1 hypothetical protein SAMN05421740_10612 [Parapedobacter koreensis]
MAEVINIINGKHVVEFGKGKFDEWCVFLTREKGTRYAPKDKDYFSILLAWAHRYGVDRIYNDFVSVYNCTTNQVDTTCLALIKKLAADYGEHDSEEVEIWFSVLYGGMIAEENKANSKLGKRIKRLGIYQLLYEGYEPAAAADFSKGKQAAALDILMRRRGF